MKENKNSSIRQFVDSSIGEVTCGRGISPEGEARAREARRYAGCRATMEGGLAVVRLLSRAARKSAAAVAAAVLSLFTFTFSLSAAEDFSGYSGKIKITASGYAGTTTLTNFPLLVKLSEGVGGFSYAACKQTDGGDVRFTRGDGEELPSSCVSWQCHSQSRFRR